MTDVCILIFAVIVYGGSAVVANMLGKRDYARYKQKKNKIRTPLMKGVLK